MTHESPSIAVLLDAADPPTQRRARDLARTLKLRLVSPDEESEVQFVLAFAKGMLELREARGRPGRGLSVDFASMNLKRGSGNLSRRQPLARAMGASAQTVLDATAGLGHDSVLLAAMGFGVVAVERSPIIAAILQDGVDRAMAEPMLRGALDDRLAVVNADARDLLRQLATKPHVIYIDPMFPPKRKASALAKKSIRLVRAIVGDDPDAAELVEIARQHATQRVVVKRPTYANPLAPDPTTTHVGKLVRYDVYVTPPRG